MEAMGHKNLKSISFYTQFCDEAIHKTLERGERKMRQMQQRAEKRLRA
jgi:hypothetical protein